MTNQVDASNRRVRYVWTTGAQVFDITFPLTDATNLAVYQNTSSTPIASSNYTVDLTAMTVTITGITLAVNDIIVLEGLEVLTRVDGYPLRGDLKSAMLNGDMNAVYYALQEMRRDLDRAMVLNKSVADTVDPTMPAPVADTVIVGNSTGTGFANGPTTANIAALAADQVNLDAVAGALTNVNTVATNITAVNTNATNITAIQNAAANAATATSEAAAASSSATSAAASATAAAASAAQGLFAGHDDIAYANSPFVPALANDGNLIRVDTSGGNVVVNLSTLATYGQDMTLAFVKITSDANTITINRGGTDTIGSGTSEVISIEFETHVLIGSKADGQWIDAVQSTGVPDGSITEAKLGLSDNTIANASTTKHGLMPKLSGNATDFAAGDGTYKALSSEVSTILDGLGATQGDILFRDASGWNVLAAGAAGDVLTSGGTGANPSYSTPSGGWTKIDEVVLSAAGYVVFPTTDFATAYKFYMIVISGPFSANQNIDMALSSDGGTTFQDNVTNGSASYVFGQFYITALPVPATAGHYDYLNHLIGTSNNLNRQEFTAPLNYIRISGFYGGTLYNFDATTTATLYGMN